MDILKRASQLEDYIIQQRRYFHRIPEPAWEEVKTTLEIEKQLWEIGLEPRRFEGISGVWTEIAGKQEKEGTKTLLLRADIDGVEVREDTGLEFSSQHQGLMHATGRDCHIAMLLGAARILKEMEAELKGSVRILFQAAEESAQGAPEYIKRGILEGVDAVYAAHVYGRLPAPLLDITYGYRMASADRINIEITGVSTHGSLPHLGKDAIAAAALVINSIQNYVSRRNNPLEPLVVSIGTIHGGHQRNTLADFVKMEGTVRAHSGKTREKVEKELRELIQSGAALMGCRAEMEYQYMLPPVINDSRLASIGERCGEKLFGEKALTHLPAVMASEDFSFYTEKIPGLYVNIGCGNPDTEERYSNYSPRFQVEERVLKNGAALCAQFAVDYLEKEGR